MIKKQKKWICMLLALTLVGMSLFSDSGASASEASSTDTQKQEEIDKLEEQKKDALKEIDNIKSDINSVKKKIKELENSKSNLKSYINKLDAESAELEKQLKELSSQIEAKEEELTATRAELEEAVASADAQYATMKDRIRYMYENGGNQYLEALLTSESIADFLNQASYISMMAEYDRNMMEKLIETKENIAAYEQQLEEEQAELEALKADVNEQNEAIELLAKAKTKEMNNYQSQINTASGEAGDYEEQLEEQEKLLEQIENQIAAAAAAAGKNDDGDGGASGFIWPCPSSKRITSAFGPRKQPTAGASTYHKGIDIGASTGSAIVAAASGRVTTATYSASAGNYITISHGNGMSTTYMHCSALYVSAGDIVEQGDTIAAVGSTGYSTGPHLHFGVIKNGSYVNPQNYV